MLHLLLVYTGSNVLVLLIKWTRLLCCSLYTLAGLLEWE